MIKKIFKIILILNLFIYVYGEDFNKFLSIGNVKIVRKEPLYIERQDLNITINKDKTITVDSDYTFKNNGKYNIKSTYMIWLDNENLAIKDKYIKNMKFYSNYKKIEHSRAVISFNEKIYDEQNNDKISREWFIINKTIKSGEKGKLNIFYSLKNLNLELEKKFVYSFNLVENFQNENEVGIFYVNIINKSDLEIDNVFYKNENVEKLKNNNRHEKYEILLGNEKINGNLVIKFK